MNWRRPIGILTLVASGCAPKPSGTCVATARPQLHTEHGAALDLDDPIAMEAAAGRPVLWCATLRPEYSGRVVNAQTGAAVEGALVVVESWRASPPLLGAEWVLLERVVARSFRTDDDGELDMATEAVWVPAILTADGFPAIVQRTCVTAPGYQPSVYEPTLGADAPWLPERIPLRPADPGAPAQAVPCQP